MIKVNPDWWKDFFGPVYLITDGRSVEDLELTRREVNLIEELLSLKKHEHILDLCGGHGRHALELARRGYSNVVVLDYSRFLLDVGRNRAKQEGIKIEFHCADARKTGFDERSFDVVILLGNSFGYLPQDEENLCILKEANRLLKKSGRFLLDITDKDNYLRNFKSFSSHRAQGQITVRRQRELRGSLVCVREVVISQQKGVIQDRTYCERLYDKTELCQLLETAGFGCLEFMDGLSLHGRQGDYGFMGWRIMVVARKQTPGNKKDKRARLFSKGYENGE
jgi:D-alanine-D-alanine ligase